MYKSVKYLTKIENGIFSTHYFYEPVNQTIFPLDTLPTNSNVPEDIKRIIETLESNLFGIKISHFEGSKYYTYLSIAKQKEMVDVLIEPSIACELAKGKEILIYVEEHILKNDGIKVTKKLIEKALTGEFISHQSFR
ncbi:hypothetical protein ACFLZ4_02315 [Patescibacteria group bacterium]